MSISLLRRLLMKEAVKDTAGSSGIMSINKNIAAKVDQQVQRYVNDAMRQGVDLDTLSPEQLKMIVQMNKPKPPRVIAADSLEGRGITEALLGKRGEVVDFPQKRSFKQEIDDMIKDGTITKGARGMKKSKKIQDREMFQDANKRLKTDVNKIIADIKAMDPMDSMKEANSVIGRKGAYKNLTPEESKKILKDTEDHIFERDIPIDPEDMASGGRAGFKGGLSVIAQGSGGKSGKEQIEGAPEGLTSNKETLNFIASLDIPITEKINLLGDIQYNKFRDKIQQGDDELFLFDPKSNRDRKIGIGFNKGGEGFSGYGKYGIDSGEPEFFLKYKKSFADGGVAGLLGERTGFQGGGASYKSSSKSSKKGRTDAQSQYGGTKGYQSSRNRSGRTTTTSGQGGGSGYTNTGGGEGGGPPGTNTGGGTTTTPTTTQPSFRERIRQKQILDYINSLEEEDLALGIGPKVGSSVLKNILKKGPVKIDDEGIGLEFLKKYNYLGDSNLKFNLDTKYKDLIKGDPKLKAGFERNIGDFKLKGDIDTDKNIGLKLTMPTNFFNRNKTKSRTNFDNRLAPDISKFNFEDMTGIKSTVPANMQLAMITDTQKDLIDKQGKIGQLTGAFDPNATFNAAKMFDDKGSSGVFGIGAREAEPMTREEFDAYINEKGYADGGPARQNFKMGKRAFLKAMLGTGAGIAGLKSGLFGIGGKEATKKAITETVKSAGSGYPPPYFFKLVEKIKFMGDDVTQKAATQEREVVKRYKDYEMTEDLGTGDIVIKKRNEGSFYDQDGIISDEYIVYKPGQADELTKGKKPPPEYDEYTVRPDSDGKLRDSEDGLDSIDEILEEVGDPDSLTLKKASGGIARMLGE